MNRLPITLALLASLTALSAAQIVAGQTDTFDSDVMGWLGAQPLWIPNGGPAGAGDGYLEYTSTGTFGQYSHMAGFNTVQWAGDYLAAGVGSISVDLRNFGATDLVMRLTFFDSTLQNRWVSNDAAVLPSGSGWQHFSFQLDSSLFTLTQGSNSFADEMHDVSRMMFRHDPGAPSASGVAVAGILGVDNIHAAPVPEPATLLALGGGLAAVARRRRARR